MLLHDAAEEASSWIGGFNIDPIVVMPVGVVGLAWAAWMWDPVALSSTLAAVVALSPVWIPFFLATSFWSAWIHYVRYIHWFALPTVVLEIQPPAEIEKSPIAMEIFLSSLWNTGNETTFLDRMWKGRGRPVWSLELVSNEGRISYYIHLRQSWKHVVEARIYGQFPDAKIFEVEDYVRKVPFNLEEYDMWCAEYVKPTKPDALPIKTYVEYGLDKVQEEAEQVDPIAPGHPLHESKTQLPAVA